MMIKIEHTVSVLIVRLVYRGFHVFLLMLLLGAQEAAGPGGSGGDLTPLLLQLLQLRG